MAGVLCARLVAQEKVDNIREGAYLLRLVKNVSLTISTVINIEMNKLVTIGRIPSGWHVAYSPSLEVVC